MIQVICPVCGAALAPQGAAWRCVQGHCFDVARQGYVNLLTVTQKHSRHPGDTREMVAARRAFLDAGWYAPIAKTLADLVRRFCPEAASVLDAGCGEGYYLSQLGWVPERWGIDISRDAVRYAAARDRSAHWLTATAAHLPFADGGFDCVLSMFALTEQIQQTEQEIDRRLDKLPDILMEDGYPDVQAFMATYREAEAVVEQYNRDLAEWERQVKQKSRPPRPPEKESVRNRLRQLQEQGRQQKPRKKSFDRGSR